MHVACATAAEGQFVQCLGCAIGGTQLARFRGLVNRGALRDIQVNRVTINHAGEIEQQAVVLHLREVAANSANGVGHDYILNTITHLKWARAAVTHIHMECSVKAHTAVDKKLTVIIRILAVDFNFQDTGREIGEASTDIGRSATRSSFWQPDSAGVLQPHAISETEIALQKSTRLIIDEGHGLQLNILNLDRRKFSDDDRIGVGGKQAIPIRRDRTCVDEARAEIAFHHHARSRTRTAIIVAVRGNRARVGECQCLHTAVNVKAISMGARLRRRSLCRSRDVDRAAGDRDTV